MPELNLDDVLYTMRKAADAAGELTRNATLEDRKNIGGLEDMVTVVDLKADKLIREIIKKDFPSSNLLSEEECKLDKNYHPETLFDFTGFLVDPIDGSVNFSRYISPNYGNFAISIGYCENGIPLVGLIYKPLEEEVFHAIRGEGAFENNHPIHVSEVSSLGKASIELGSFWIRDKMDLFHKWFNNHKTDVNQILIRGSAAAALADVARGRIEAMLHSRLNPWDYAAGWILVEEAGGIMMDGHMRHLKMGSASIFACNRALNEDIVRILQGK